VALRGAQAQVAHVHAVVDSPAQPGGEDAAPPGEAGPQHPDAVKLAIGRGGAYDARAGRAVPEHVLVRLRIVDQALRPFADGHVSADAPGQGGVAGVYSAVDDRYLHSFARAVPPGPLLRDVLDGLDGAEGLQGLDSELLAPGRPHHPSPPIPPIA